MKKDKYTLKCFLKDFDDVLINTGVKDKLTNKDIKKMVALLKTAYILKGAENCKQLLVKFERELNGYFNN